MIMHGIHGYWMKKHNIQIIKIEMIFYAKNDKKLMQIHKIWAKTFFTRRYQSCTKDVLFLFCRCVFIFYQS